MVRQVSHNPRHDERHQQAESDVALRDKQAGQRARLPIEHRRAHCSSNAPRWQHESIQEAQDGSALEVWVKVRSKSVINSTQQPEWSIQCKATVQLGRVCQLNPQHLAAATRAVHAAKHSEEWPQIEKHQLWSCEAAPISWQPAAVLAHGRAEFRRNQACTRTATAA